MEDNTQVLGKITICFYYCYINLLIQGMGMAFIRGRMEGNMRDSIIMIKKMDLESMCGPMAVVMKASGITGNSMELENLYKMVYKKQDFGNMVRDLNG